MTDLPLTIIILTHNSQATLKKTLESASWCPNILIIDHQSTDKTLQMAQKFKARIIKKPLNHHFSRQRNFALQKAQTPWVLFLDSDETITPDLKKEILKTILKPQKHNFQLKRQDWFLNQKLNFGETAHLKLTRLIQKQTGQWQGTVHETFISKLPLKTLKQPLIHQRHLTFSQFLQRINYYSTLQAQQLKSTQSFSLFQLLIYPPAKFIKNYFLLLGFLDGLPGLAMALAMSLHSLFVRIKLYEISYQSKN